MKAKEGMKRYRIMDGAPDHFFPHAGIVKAGSIVDYAGKPGNWLEEVKEVKAKAKTDESKADNLAD